MTRAIYIMTSAWKSAGFWFRGPYRRVVCRPIEQTVATMKDHPIEYAEFEGIIPEGQGTVMVWDGGTYETQGDLLLEQQLAGGELKIELHGKKPRGPFVLIHIWQRSGTPREKSYWLLIKRKDKWADRKWKAEAPEMSRSAISGRTLDEIAHRPLDIGPLIAVPRSSTPPM